MNEWWLERGRDGQKEEGEGWTDGRTKNEGRRKELRAINTKFTVASVRNDVNLEAKKRKKNFSPIFSSNCRWKCEVCN